MTERGGQQRPRPAPSVSAVQWFAALERAGAGAGPAAIAAILECHPDSIRRYRRRFGSDPSALPVRSAVRPATRAPARTAGRLREPLSLPVVPARPNGAAEPGQIVYGYGPDGSPLSGPLGFVLFAGQRGSGKSTALAAAAEQVAGQLVVIDPHGRTAGSLTDLLGLDPATVATTQAEALDRIAAVRAEMLARLAGTSADRTPLLLLIDEYAALVHPPGPAVDVAIEHVLAVGLQGRKVAIGAWIGTQRPAGPGSGLPRALRDGVDGRVVLRLEGQDILYATGRAPRQLPADPAALRPGEALVQPPGGTELVLARIPRPTQDGPAAPVPAALPVIDAELAELRRARELHHAQGDALETISAALGDLRGAVGVGHLRRALEEAGRAVRRASSPEAVLKVVSVYASDLANARARAVQAEQLRRARTIEPFDFEPDDQEDDDDQEDAPELPAWTPRPGVLALGALAFNAAAGSRIGMEAAARQLGARAAQEPERRGRPPAGADLPGRVRGSRYLYR